MKCRICHNENLKKFLSLGNTPLANSFLSKKDLNKEERIFPLEVCFCADCKLVQLTNVVPPELMFKNYVYVSSTTSTFKLHFANMAEEISKLMNLNKNSLAVDIGSNDGLLLKNFQKFGVRAIGVEPASNIAKIAEQNGVETINDFFNDDCTNKIIAEDGNADVITATNVFAHVDDIQNFVRNVKLLLKDDGIFVIEVPYLVDMLQKMTFDTIYHEHLSYFSITSLIYFFKQFGMDIFSVKNVNSHGGSLRLFVRKHEAKFSVDDTVNGIATNERKLKIDDFGTYSKFANKVYDTKMKLVQCLKDIKDNGKAIAGYGAPAKANTLLNFCKIGTNWIDYIVEDNSLKQGLFTPGTHIPVVGPRMLDEQKPDYILILAWNFADEILNKTKKYKDFGIKFILPLPEPTII